ncbi:hypothetical protein ACKWTF_014714 [Chironomus riparius]
MVAMHGSSIKITFPKINPFAFNFHFDLPSFMCMYVPYVQQNILFFGFFFIRCKKNISGRKKVEWSGGSGGNDNDEYEKVSSKQVKRGEMQKKAAQHKTCRRKAHITFCIFFHSHFSIFRCASHTHTHTTGCECIGYECVLVLPSHTSATAAHIKHKNIENM